MAQKPITLARHDYMRGIVNLTNQSGLPAFVMVEVLEQAARELRPAMDAELKKAEANYRAALQREQEESNDSTDQTDKE